MLIIFFPSSLNAGFSQRNWTIFFFFPKKESRPAINKQSQDPFLKILLWCRTQSDTWKSKYTRTLKTTFLRLINSILIFQRNHQNENWIRAQVKVFAVVGVLWPALSSGTVSDTDSPCKGSLSPWGKAKHITFYIFAPLLFGLSLMLKVCHNDIEGIAINLSPGRNSKAKNSQLPSTRRSPKCTIQMWSLCLLSSFDSRGECRMQLCQHANMHLVTDAHMTAL